MADTATAIHTDAADQARRTKRAARPRHPV